MIVGATLIVANAVVGIWGLIAYRRDSPPGSWYVQALAIAHAIIGAIGLIFICLLRYFGYAWYHRNRMAISLMPDKQRNILYAGLGAVTVTAALWSLSQFNLLDLGPFGVPVVAVFLGGL